jgi:hypothetical protein
MGEEQDIAWNEESSLELNEAAVASCRVTLLPDEDDPLDIRIDGCPGCGHASVFVEPLVVVRGPNASQDAKTRRALRDALARAQPPVRDRNVVAYCQCQHAHPQAPPGTQGCGRYWTLRIEW